MTMKMDTCFLRDGYAVWIPSALVSGSAPGSPVKPSCLLWGKKRTQIHAARFTVTTPNHELALHRAPVRGAFRRLPNICLPRLPARTTVACDGWCLGDPVVNPRTRRPDDRWYRLSPSVFAPPMPHYRSPVAGTGWSQTYGSPFHAVGRGYGGADDRHAFDLNLEGDRDAGKPVYPVYDGDVVVNDPSYGYLVVKHHEPLQLRNGRRVRPWYSGYMHMTSLANQKRVTPQDRVGRIGNVTAKGSVPNHLHFAIYEESEPGSTRRLKSIDINVLPTAILVGITRWIDWRGDKARAIAGALPAAALGA